MFRLLTFGLPVAICWAACGADEEPTITVTSEVVRPSLSPVEFCGVNWEHTGQLHSLRQIWRNGYKEFIDFLQANGLHTFRYPGGGYVERFHPGVGSEKWFAQFKEKAGGPYQQDDWIEYEEFLQFLKDGDFRAIVQVNTFSAFDPGSGKVVKLLSEDGELVDNAVTLATEAAAQAVRIAKQQDAQAYVPYWEIGNEDYGAYRPEQYARIAFEFIGAMRRVAPQAHFIVTTQWSFPSARPSNNRLGWSRQVLIDLKKLGLGNEGITFVNHEYAWAMEGKEHSAYDEWQRYVGTNPTHRYEQPWGKLPCSPYELLFRAYDETGFYGADLCVSEFRYGWMTNLYNKSLAAGVGNVNLILHYIKHPRIRGCVIHSLIHGSAVHEQARRPFSHWGFNIIEYTPTPSIPHNFISTPVSQGYRLVDKFCHGELLKAESSDGNLNVAAARDGDTYRLLVVNRSRETEQLANTNAITAAIVLPRGVRPTSAVAHVLNSDNLADRSGLLGTFDRVREIIVHQRQLATPPDADLLVEFQPHSATLVELTL